MKRILTLIIATTLAAALSAQQYKMRITDAQQRTIDNLDYVEFLDGNQVYIPYNFWSDSLNTYIYDNKNVPTSSLRSIDFITTGNRSWELNYAPRIFDSSNRPDDFGYGSVMHMRDLMTEDMTGTDNGYNWYRVTLESNLQPSYAQAYIIWYFYIDAIMQCSEIISTIGYQPASDHEKALLSEALITRAMLNLDFARMFEFLPNEKTSGLTENGINVTGLTVPIIDDNTVATGGAYYSPRVSKDEMARYILDDLGRADALVSSITNPSHEVPHADVICGMYARLAMWTGDYFYAYLNAESAIKLSESRPMTVDEMLSTTKGFNDVNCWMWGVQQTPDKNYADYLTNFVSWLSPEYEGYAQFVPSMISRSLYDRISNSDPRKLLFIAPEGSPLSGQTPLINPEASYAPYTSVKFRPADGKQTWDEGGSFTAYPLMRIEEIYFIRAEALAYSDPAAALQLLNEFMRQYRDPSYSFSSTDRDEIIREIILQKRIELWGEGQTFFDVKRLNMNVTRQYDGTNFYDACAFNTTGRPWWMNVTIPDAAANSNLALYGYGNPQTNTDARVWETLRFQQPAFLSDLDALPIDSIVYLLLHLQVPEELRLSSGTLEVSLSPNFQTGQTIKLTNAYTTEDDVTTIRVSASGLYSTLYSIAAVNELPATGVINCYLRARIGEALSSILVLPIRMPQQYSGPKTMFSYLPTVTATPVATIDCEAMAAEDYVKVIDISLQGQGDYYRVNEATVGAIYFFDTRGNFAFNADGSTDNTYNLFYNRAHEIYDYMLQRADSSHTFTDAFTNIYVQRGDLVGVTINRGLEIGFKFNRQQMTESRYTWSTTYNDVFTSEFNKQLSGTNINIQNAQGTQIYRIVAPYQRNHNILFVPSDSLLTVPWQMAYHNATEGSIYVGGTGQRTSSGAYKFTLTFADSVGHVIGTYNEQIGEDLTWKSLGTGTITENFLYVATGEVEIQVCEQHPERFRILKPFDSLNAAVNYTPDGSQSPYMDITIMQPGETFQKVSITQPDLVFFTETNTGYYHSNYEQYIKLYHPGHFSSLSNEQYFLHSRVISYQADGHTPAQIQLAPYYYMDGVGGWNTSQEDNMLIINFPVIGN